MTRTDNDVRMGTSIPVSDDVADKLYDRKGRGETYDDTLRDLLGMKSGSKTEADA